MILTWLCDWFFFYYCKYILWFCQCIFRRWKLAMWTLKPCVRWSLVTSRRAYPPLPQLPCQVRQPCVVQTQSQTPLLELCMALKLYYTYGSDDLYQSQLIMRFANFTHTILHNTDIKCHVFSMIMSDLSMSATFSYAQSGLYKSNWPQYKSCWPHL